MSESKKKSRSRVRLTAAGSASSGYSLAGPIPADQFVSISSDAAALKPAVEAPLPFTFCADLSGVSIAHLRPSGFGSEGEPVDSTELQQQEQQVDPVVEAEPEPPALAAIVAAPPQAPVSSTHRYEPMEFLDFYDSDEEDEFQTYTEPEPAAPESEPPAMATAPLAVPVRFATLGPAKLMQGATDIPMPSLPVQLPDIQLRTVRRKMVIGANPNKPVIKPAPAPPAPAPKQTPQVVVRPAPALKQAPKPATRPVSTPIEQPLRTVPAPTAKPAMAARDRGSALSVQHEPEPSVAPAPAPKPKLMPIRRVEAPLPSERALETGPVLGMPVDSGRMPAATKSVVAVGAVLVLGIAGYFGFSGKTSKYDASKPADTITDSTSQGLIMGGGGWTTTWGSDAPANKGKQISIYRPSMAMMDYRFEFRGQIERKALGWIFRASNSKNYYVFKLETIRPGATPVVALVRYAVVDGKETTRTQIMLPFEVALDTVYQVRFEAKGDKFTTYVQNKLVDYWTDDRIKTGGIGFYNDKGERGQIQSSQVAYLTAGR